MAEELKFETPLYTLHEAAWFLGLPDSTLRRWAGRESEWQLVTASGATRRREPVVPFIGLAEGFVVRAFRRHAGRRLPAKKILEGLQWLRDRGGVEHVLASKRLYTDGSTLLYDFAEEGSEERELANLFTKNQVFEKVVAADLKLLTYDNDGYAGAVVLPFTRRPIAVASPGRAFGQPVFIKGGARVIDVLDRFDGGDDPPDIADDFDVPVRDVLDIVRAASRRGRQAA